MTKKTHIGLIGCGAWGKHILRDLKILNCYVTALSPSHKNDNNAVIADNIIDDITQLPSVDGIVIATPTNTHGEILKKLHPLNIPIFVEKPLVSSLKEAEEIYATMSTKEIFVMDKWRYHPGIEKLAEIARTKELGEVLSLRTKRTDWGNRHTDVDGTWTLLPHDLTIILEILGEIPTPYASVATEWGNQIVSHLSFLKNSHGPWCSIEMSTASPISKREVLLECEQGVAILDDSYDAAIKIFHRSTHTGYAEKTYLLCPIDNEMPLLVELRRFVNFIEKKGPPPKSDLYAGVKIVETIDALRKLANIQNSGILL